HRRLAGGGPRCRPRTPRADLVHPRALGARDRTGHRPAHTAGRVHGLRRRPHRAQRLPAQGTRASPPATGQGPHVADPMTQPMQPDTPGALAARFEPGALAAMVAVQQQERAVIAAAKVSVDEIKASFPNWLTNGGLREDTRVLVAAVDALVAAERSEPCDEPKVLA